MIPPVLPGLVKQVGKPRASGDDPRITDLISSYPV